MVYWQSSDRGVDCSVGLSSIFFAFPVTVLVMFLSHCAENHILPLNEQFNYFQYLIIILHRFPLVTVPR